LETPKSIERSSVGDGALRITLADDGHGVVVSSITDNGTEVLNTGGASEIFILDITNPGTGADVEISASSGWGMVTTTNDGTNCTVELEGPQSADLPTSLKATVTLQVEGTHSRWDVAVSGLGPCTLNEVVFPRLNIKAQGDDHFLVPRYSGIVIDNPVAAGLDWHEFYPAGWHASMQFLSYFNADEGLYFGFHDSRAAIKRFDVDVEGGGVVVGAHISAAGRSNPGNDWEMPGVFELDVFQGDWYDAAGIYRAWVMAEADYWPPDDPARDARVENMAQVSVWATFGGGYSPDVVESNTIAFSDYMGVPTGLTWYEWNYLGQDEDYPEYFPEQTGMTEAVTNLQARDIAVVPYINGRLFDTSLDGSGHWGLDFATDGEPYATKDVFGNLFTQTFAGNLFAVMCPTQSSWQDILKSATDRLTRDIGSAGVYIDQVGAATPMQCMVPGHGHSLGGGDWWRGGYSQMFGRIHSAIPGGRFLTTESGVDSMTADVEGFMVQGWQADSMVPAFQAVYSGKVLLFGMKTGVSQYDQPQFYCKLAQAFAHGIQLGRFYTSIQNATGADANAPIFVRRLARIRHKLNQFISFGRMMRPLELSGIPEITTTWTYTYDGDLEVTIPAIETSTWMTDEAGRKAVILLFVNASMTDTLSFDFDFDAAEYELDGQLYLQEIDDLTEGPVGSTPSVFTRNVTLAPMGAVAFMVSTSSAPLGTYIFSDGFEAGNTSVWSATGS
jgi:hypothetical protein